MTSSLIVKATRINVRARRSYGLKKQASPNRSPRLRGEKLWSAASSAARSGGLYYCCTLRCPANPEIGPRLKDGIGRNVRPRGWRGSAECFRSGPYKNPDISVPRGTKVATRGKGRGGETANLRSTSDGQSCHGYLFFFIRGKSENKKKACWACTHRYLVPGIIIKIKNTLFSCEIEGFVETHLCELCVILRSRVLRVCVSSLRI